MREKATAEPEVSFHFTAIPATEVDWYAGVLLSLFQKPIERLGLQHKFRPEDILAGCRKRDYQAWMVWSNNAVHAVYITQIRSFPTGFRELRIFLASGEGREIWLGQVVDTLLDFAKTLKCGEVSWEGRPGWKRVLRRHLPSEIRVTPTYKFEV